MDLKKKLLSLILFADGVHFASISSHMPPLRVSTTVYLLFGDGSQSFGTLFQAPASGSHWRSRQCGGDRQFTRRLATRRATLRYLEPPSVEQCRHQESNE